MDAVHSRPKAYQIYSRPKVTAEMRKQGYVDGKNFDIKEDARWDFCRGGSRQELRDIITHEPPNIIICSPPCTFFSILQGLSVRDETNAEYRRAKAVAILHINFCMELCRTQVKEGRYFVFEHPAEARSRNMPTVQAMLQNEHTIVCNLRPTWIITNAYHNGIRLNRKEKVEHGCSRVVSKIAEGIRDQDAADEMGLGMVGHVAPEGNTASRLKGAKYTMEKCHGMETVGDMVAIDDVSGAYLDPREVIKARLAEVDYIRKMNLYTKVPIAECWKVTGKQPIATKWIDVNKQDTANLLYRSRLVGKEFNTYNDTSLYSATPPLEALRLIVSIAASNDNYHIMTNDVSRPYFYAPVQEGAENIRQTPGGGHQ